MFMRRRLLQVLSFIVIVTMMFSVLQLPSVSAQGSDGIKRGHNAQTGKVSFIGPESGRSLSAAKALGVTVFGRPSDPGLALAKRYGPEFGLKNPGRDLTKLKTHQADNGRLSVRFQQNYQGIPVMGGELIVNTNADGDLYSINGEVSPDISVYTRPAVSVRQARQTALQAIAKWHQMEPEDFGISTPELWIYDESLLRSSARPVELVWRMEVTAKDLRMPIRELVLVNAQRGTISLHFNQIDTSWNVSGGTGTLQDVTPTATPQPTATPEPLATPGPTGGIEEEAPASGAGNGGVITLSGVTFYVATTGSDTRNCSTPALACANIQKAISVAGTNDTIKVASGTYYRDTYNYNPSPNVVILQNKSLVLSGGWNVDFSSQTGVSTIDGSDGAGTKINNGILAISSTLVVDRLVIQNSTSSNSGAIYLSGGTFTLKNSTLRDNTAGQGAGAFVTDNPVFNVINSTISGNTASSRGGGIYVNSGTVNIEYSTIVYNNTSLVTGTGGGVYRNGASVLNIHNSILSNNTGSTSPNCNSLSTSDYNVIGSTDGCSLPTGTHDARGVPDAGIESTLSGTMPVHALLPGSSAINRGESTSCTTNAESHDQRGITRPIGAACDSGAFEFENLEPGVPHSIAISGGNDQEKQVSQAFDNPLAVLVLDGYADPVEGASVTFSAPGSGASGTFASSGTAIDIVTTNASGIATSSIFTANSLAGSHTVSASVGTVDPASFSLQNLPLPGTPDSISVVSGNNQHAQINEAYTNPLSVSVLDYYGDPVPSGIDVTFTAPDGGPSGIFANSASRIEMVATDGSGTATSSVFTANGSVGAVTVNVTVEGADAMASFSLNNLYTSGIPMDIVQVSGGNQQGVLNKAFLNPLVARVEDGNGDPVSGVSVTFTAPGSGASGTFPGGVLSESVWTGLDGIATSPTFTANGTVGAYNVSAAVDGFPYVTNFNLNNRTALYVSPGGVNTGTCRNPASPCATINYAIGQAAAGELIRVATGTYTGTGSEVVLINKSVSLSGGWNADFTVQTGNSTLDGQAARRGVSVYSGCIATIERFTVKNASSSSAGAVDNSYGTLTINSSTISNNATRGIYNSGTLTVNNSTVSGNGGGGLYNRNGTTTVNNSTISGNSAGQGGGIYSSSGTIILKNTIVAGNSATSYGPDCYSAISSITSGGYNLIGSESNCTFNETTGDQVGNPATPIDPKLGVFIESLGYYPLQAGSPAIDAGNPAVPGSGGDACLPADQRGLARPVGGRCDIGAYEYAAPGVAASLVIVSGDGQRVLPGLAFANPLKVVVLDDKGNPVPGMEMTFTAPDSGPSGTFAPGGALTTTVTTDASGVVTSPTFTANGNAGFYTVVASAVGTESVDFNLQNATLFVAPTGGDANNCQTATTPCATINGAIAKAITGDVIRIAAGTYTGTGTEVMMVNKSITLSGGWNADFTAQMGTSTIDGQDIRRGVTVSNYATAVIERITVRSGKDTSGAGVNINSSSTLTLKDSTIRNNSGYGVYNTGILTVNNSTISANTSGGLFSSWSTTINNSTISGNMSSGGIYRYANTVTLKNTIVAGNSATGPGWGQDCYPSITSAGYNLIGNAGGCTFTMQTGDKKGMDPGLGVFIEALGLYPLQSGSPAIDAGNPAMPGSGGNACLAADQRGVARTVGARCDIGAFEYMAPGSPASLAIVSGDNQHAIPGVAFANPLKVVIVDSQGNLVPGVEVTFTAPDSGPSGTFAPGSMLTTTVTTDVSGLATSPVFTPNEILGSYMVAASVTGVGSVNFNLQNTFWYVAPIGSDANDCQTATTPCATIMGAMQKAIAGDVIKIGTGTYTGAGGYQTVVNVNKSITLSGGWNADFTAQTGRSTIDGQGIRSGVTVSNTGTTVIERVTVQNAYDYWGGVYIPVPGTLILNNSIIRNNEGSGIYNAFGETVIVNNSTVTGNTDSGITHERGTMTVNNSTISANSALDGGGILRTGGTIILKNTILAGNTATNSGPDCSGMIDSAGYNLIGNPSGCTFTPVTGDLTNVNPQLGVYIEALGYYLLQAGSPAIDAGNPAVPGSGGDACLATDQRDLARTFGGRCDIGAFEYEGIGTVPAYVIVNKGTPQYIATGTQALAVLQVVVIDDNGDTVAGKTVTFIAPASGASAVFATTNRNTVKAVTNVYGLAASPAFSANSTPGGYVIRASVAGGLGSADFQIVNGSQVKTYSANNTGALPGTLKCTAAKPECTSGMNPHADSAHAHAIGAYLFYLTQHGRLGLDNNNMTIISTVDYCDVEYEECPFFNAYWSGTQVVYGNGKDYPLADDVVVHELTHGVTQYESNLFYYYQSGAINESFSDLWGEYYDQIDGYGSDGAGVRWLVGEDLDNAMRSMSNPSAAPYYDPDKMSSSYYNESSDDSGGVHANSGINNKAVFLMVDGGDFNGKTISPLGWEKTIAIYYEANTNLLSSGADYSDLYYALQQACTNVIGKHGITSGDCVEVTEALDAVEMHAQPATNFNTDGAYCDGDNFINFVFTDDLESGTGNWTFANGAYKRWQLDSIYGLYAHSGEHSLYADDWPGRITNATARLAAHPIPTNAYLHFSHAYGFEADYEEVPPGYYDGGVIEFSANNGTTWTNAGSLMEYNGYDKTINTEWGNPLAGQMAFAGDSHGYIGTRLNLTSLAGQTVTFRWRMGLDQGTSEMGWWVDDVRIYQCLPRDLVAPGPVTGLTVTPGPTDGIADLSWIAPSDDVVGPPGPVAAYFIKWSDEPFTSWEDGTLVTSGLPIPVAPNGAQEMSVSGLLAGEPYYFAVRAQDEQFNLGPYVTASGIAGFTRAESLGAPILQSPPHKGVTNDLTPRLDWKDHQPRAAYYRVQVATSSAFEPASLVQNELADLSEFDVPADLTPGSTYYWRVQAYDFDDQPAVWSAVRYFTIDTLPPPVPAASFPASGDSVRGVPLFRWSRADGAVRYQFEIDDNETFDSPLFSIVQRLTFRRLPGGVRGTYYWRVRAQDAVGNWSDWSPASTITILPAR